MFHIFNKWGERVNGISFSHNSKWRIDESFIFLKMNGILTASIMSKVLQCTNLMTKQKSMAKNKSQT